jgi:hypothetical protein
MRSLYDDIFASLEGNTFTIPDVTVREPYDESPKTYPALILYEIVNVPKTHATVTGEGRTTLSYQVNIQTQNCVNTDGDVLNRWKAAQHLAGEISDLLSTAYKVTRRTITPGTDAAGIVEYIWRGDCVLDSYGYAYRS